MVLFLICWMAITIPVRRLALKSVIGVSSPPPRRSAKWALGLLIATPLALTAFFAIDNALMSSKLDRLLAEDKIHGRISSFEESIPPKLSSFITDLGQEYRNINKFFNADAAAQAARRLIAGEADARQEVEALLNENSELAPVMDKLGSYEPQGPDEDAHGAAGSFMQRSAIQYNKLRMLIAAHNGDSDAAFKFWRQNLNMSKQLAKSNSLSPTNTNSTYNDTLITLNHCLAMGLFDAAQIEEIIEDIQGFEPTIATAWTNFSDALKIVYIYFFQTAGDDEDMPPKHIVVIPLTPATDWLRFKASLDTMRLYRRYLPLDGEIEWHKNPDARFSDTICSGSNLDYYGHQIAWNYEQANDALARGRATQVLAAAELFRRDHGELPRSQGELVPNYLEALPIDPYTGSPLIYEFTTIDIPTEGRKSVSTQVLLVRADAEGERKPHHEAFRIIDIVK